MAFFIRIPTLYTASNLMVSVCGATASPAYHLKSVTTSVTNSQSWCQFTDLDEWMAIINRQSKLSKA